MSTRVVVWGTGVVGSMVIAEIARHPEFELVGVGVHDPDKVGRDAGELAGIDPLGVTATDDIDALIALRPDGVAHYGPTAAHADENIRVIGAFLRAGIDVASTAMTPWVWPSAPANPAAVDRTDRGGVRGRWGTLFHHRHRPGVRERSVPPHPDGPVRGGRIGHRPGVARLHRLRR